MAKLVVWKENEQYIEQLKTIAKSEGKPLSVLIRETLRAKYPENKGV